MKKTTEFILLNSSKKGLANLARSSKPRLLISKNLPTKGRGLLNRDQKLFHSSIPRKDRMDFSKFGLKGSSPKSSIKGKIARPKKKSSGKDSPKEDSSYMGGSYPKNEEECTKRLERIDYEQALSRWRVLKEAQLQTLLILEARDLELLRIKFSNLTKEEKNLASLKVYRRCKKDLQKTSMVTEACHSSNSEDESANSEFAGGSGEKKKGTYNKSTGKSGPQDDTGKGSSQEGAGGGGPQFDPEEAIRDGFYSGVGQTIVQGIAAGATIVAGAVGSNLLKSPKSDKGSDDVDEALAGLQLDS